MFINDLSQRIKMNSEIWKFFGHIFCHNNYYPETTLVDLFKLKLDTIVKTYELNIRNIYEDLRTVKNSIIWDKDVIQNSNTVGKEVSKFILPIISSGNSPFMTGACTMLFRNADSTLLKGDLGKVFAELFNYSNVVNFDQNKTPEIPGTSFKNWIIESCDNVEVMVNDMIEACKVVLAKYNIQIETEEN